MQQTSFLFEQKKLLNMFYSWAIHLNAPLSEEISAGY